MRSKLVMLYMTYIVCSAGLFSIDASAIDITTTEGRTYKNATVTRTEPDGITITISTGVIKLYFEELPSALQRKYGYDPQRANSYRTRAPTGPPGPTAANAGPSAIPQPTASNRTPEPINASPISERSAPRRNLVLPRGWETSFQGGSETRKGLARLLSPWVQSAPNTSGAPIEIYQSVMYLMPLPEAVARLGIRQQLASKNAVVCPGFPKDCFFFYAVDGAFEGGYNRMLIVTDNGDQVVSVELISEHPESIYGDRGFTLWLRADANAYCYNFVEHRTKTRPDYKIYAELNREEHDKWIRLRDDGNSDIDAVRADIALISYNSRPRHRGESQYRVLEATRWYIPRPLAELLLFCCQR